MQPEYVKRAGDTMTGDLHLVGEPGDETVDRTNRLIVESYQMAFQSQSGEGIRLMLMDPAAKNMIAWYDQFTDPEHPQPVAWVGAHFATHIPDLFHQHWSVETSIANGEMHTRLGITYGQDLAQLTFNRSEFLFISSQGGKFRIGVAAAAQQTEPRDLVFVTGDWSPEHHRWTLRCDTAPESGNNAGSHLRLMRHSDTGEHLDTPIVIHRNNGHVGFGTEDLAAGQVTAAAPVTALRLVGSASSPWTGLLRMEPSNNTGLVVDVRPAGSTASQFVITGAGRIEWGGGSTARDVSVSRSTPGGVATLRTGADVEVDDPSRGVVLRSPNGSRWRLTVDNAGNLGTAPLQGG